MADDIARQSEFNELVFKMGRVNKLQDNINTYWRNPKGVWMNPENEGGGSEFGFILLFYTLRSLYTEVRPKCTDEEKKEMDEIITTVMDFIDEEKVFKLVKKYNNLEKSFDEDNWKKLIKILHHLDYSIRDLLDNHGFSPDNDMGDIL